MILDAFCGCGTTLEAAARLGRRWIGIDHSPTACRVMGERLEQIGLSEGRDLSVWDMPKTEADLRRMPHFEFQNWAVIRLGGIPNRVKTGDFGIDGRLYLADVTKERRSGFDLFGEMDRWYPIQVNQVDQTTAPRRRRSRWPSRRSERRSSPSRRARRRTRHPRCGALRSSSTMSTAAGWLVGPPTACRRMCWSASTRGCSRHGREKRTTCVAYVTEVRAFFRFLDRRRWLDPDVPYERMKDGLRELIGRSEYKTPRIDDAVALVVTYVNELPVPAGRDQEQARLTLLRDRALLRTLWATGMRREELSRLNRTDIQDGRASEGLITGKGNKDRVVFVDESSLEAIRDYLEARCDSCTPNPRQWPARPRGTTRPGSRPSARGRRPPRSCARRGPPRSAARRSSTRHLWRRPAPWPA